MIDPYGHYVTEPVWDKEAIIYADLDMDKVPASRMEFDACGHYSIHARMFCSCMLQSKAVA